MFNFVRIIAGGSFVAARELIRGTKLAMNWCGGWHHAMSSEAQGFCYVNDIVIAINKLLQKFQRILYIDLDVHHGNGVESAFIGNSRVLTMSLHLYEPGFYPCTGGLDEVGNESALYSTVNIPFRAGLSDQNLNTVFSRISEKVLECFSPDAIVVQCGADGLNKDPLGGFSLTLQGLGTCVQQILSWDKPTLFLGGGGYNSANAARLWTYLTSLIVGKEISNDIPDHKYFLEYGKGYSYELHISPGQRVDLNTPEYLESIVTKVLDNLQHLKTVID
ncbi:hypothetical protein B566_EDAN017113 [Ephemera danica]|nr:hypothetical protein B566_EDAN017113 [Ephemera danica]